jgi:hypothetical protein
MGGDLVGGDVGLQINQIVRKDFRPDDVHSINVRNFGFTSQEAQPSGQLIDRSFRGGQHFHMNSGLASELADFLGAPVLIFLV